MTGREAVEIVLVRHGQASFGAADYDRLSALGREQAGALGGAMRRLGLIPDAVFTGGLRRQRETWEAMAPALGLRAEAASREDGLDEYDARGLMARRGGGPHADRRAHFRALREAVLAWQRGEVAAPPESWEAFAARVARALARMAGCGGRLVLGVSSGGAIAQAVAAAVGAPPARMVELQLQIRNCALARLRVGRAGLHLSSFNETPHVSRAADARLLSYS